MSRISFLSVICLIIGCAVASARDLQQVGSGLGRAPGTSGFGTAPPPVTTGFGGFGNGTTGNGTTGNGTTLVPPSPASAASAACASQLSSTDTAGQTESICVLVFPGVTAAACEQEGLIAGQDFVATQDPGEHTCDARFSGGPSGG